MPESEVHHGTSVQNASEINDHQFDLFGRIRKGQPRYWGSTLTDNFSLALSWANKRNGGNEAVLTYQIPAASLVDLGSIVSPMKNHVYCTNVLARPSEITDAYLDNLRMSRKQLAALMESEDLIIYKVLFKWLTGIEERPNYKILRTKNSI